MEETGLQHDIDWLCTNLDLCDTHTAVLGRMVSAWKYLARDSAPTGPTPLQAESSPAASLDSGSLSDPEIRVQWVQPEASTTAIFR